MFTGIIAARGRVLRLGGLKLEVEGPLAKIRLGDSVAVNGVCLTVVQSVGSARRRRMVFDLSPETLQRTSLGDWKAGRIVNLETALRAGDPLGGHFVQGHVDGVGTLVSRRPNKGGAVYGFQAPKALARYLVSKGSVAVDGISLTVVRPRKGRFDVAVIPHTERVTNLGSLKIGDPVNIEADMMAKHMAQLTSAWRRP
ncbi:MAG: riboflavin synthase [Elusimicrobia bacterium]|nr:riboflavin synthase [Elusimicrobiota bacterium]